MALKKQYRLVDDAFLDSAPLVLAGQANVPVAAEVAFAHLADSNSWSNWYPSMKRSSWTSSAPYGVTSTRVVHLRARPELEQQVIVWDPGYRIVFCYTRGREPGVAAGAEEVWLRPLSATSCELRWRSAIDVPKFAKIMPKIAALIFRIHPAGKTLQSQVPRAFANYMAQQLGQRPGQQ